MLRTPDGPCDSLYLCPHGDDVLLACAARLLTEVRSGARVVMQVLFGGPEAESAWKAAVSGFPELCSVDVTYAAMSAASTRDPHYSEFSSLLGEHREADQAALGRAVEVLNDLRFRLRPQHVYIPLGLGGHVDHRLCYEAGLRVFESGEGRNVFLYEERPEAFVPGAARLRLAQLGAWLPPAAVPAVENAGGARQLLRYFHLPAQQRGDVRRWGERVSGARAIARAWSEVSAWQPQRGLGPRLQPIIHAVDGELASAASAIAASVPMRKIRRSAERRLRELGLKYGARLGEARLCERYWLLLPHREGERSPLAPGRTHTV